MPRITSSGPSNNPLERWDALRRGTSSSTSGSTPDKSGPSGTTDHPSPAPAVESHSSPALPARRVSSSADSTDGSGHATGSSPQSLSGSSADSAAPKEAILDPALSESPIVSDEAVERYAGLSGHEAMELAREEYEKSNFDESEKLLDVAEERGANSDAVASARGYVRAARSRSLAASPSDSGASPDGPSEGDPASGGFLVP